MPSSERKLVPLMWKESEHMDEPNKVKADLFDCEGGVVSLKQESRNKPPKKVYSKQFTRKIAISG